MLNVDVEKRALYLLNLSARKNY